MGLIRPASGLPLLNPVVGVLSLLLKMNILSMDLVMSSRTSGLVACLWVFSKTPAVVLIFSSPTFVSLLKPRGKFLLKDNIGSNYASSYFIQFIQVPKWVWMPPYCPIIAGTFFLHSPDLTPAFASGGPLYQPWLYHPAKTNSTYKLH